MEDTKLFRMRGKSFPAILQSALDEAVAVVAKHQKVYIRHRDEIENYRSTGMSNPVNGVDFVQRSLVIAESILTYGEHSKANYEIHMLRLGVMGSIDSAEAVDIEHLFGEARRHFGIAPLYGAILSAHRTLDYLYDFTDRSQPPQLDLLMFDFLDIEVAILQLYISYSDQFGRDALAREMASGQ